MKAQAFRDGGAPGQRGRQGIGRSGLTAGENDSARRLFLALGEGLNQWQDKPGTHMM